MSLKSDQLELGFSIYVLEKLWGVTAIELVNDLYTGQYAEVITDLYTASLWSCAKYTFVQVYFVRISIQGIRKSTNLREALFSRILVAHELKPIQKFA